MQYEILLCIMLYNKAPEIMHGEQQMKTYIDKNMIDFQCFEKCVRIPLGWFEQNLRDSRLEVPIFIWSRLRVIVLFKIESNFQFVAAVKKRCLNFCTKKKSNDSGVCSMTGGLSILLSVVCNLYLFVVTSVSV